MVLDQLVIKYNKLVSSASCALTIINYSYLTYDIIQVWEVWLKISTCADLISIADSPFDKYLMYRHPNIWCSKLDLNQLYGLYYKENDICGAKFDELMFHKVQFYVRNVTIIIKILS